MGSRVTRAKEFYKTFILNYIICIKDRNLQKSQKDGSAHGHSFC